MKIDLTRLMYGQTNQLQVDEEMEVPNELLINTDITRMSNVNVKGIITTNNDAYDMEVTANGYMILPCARTLKEVKHDFNIQISERFGDENEEGLQIIQNKVDIFPIIWQYILSDVPLRVLHPDAKESPLSGDGWRLITEDDEKEVIDPRLAKLEKYKEE